jgi:hypothetical protein
MKGLSVTGVSWPAPDSEKATHQDLAFLPIRPQALRKLAVWQWRQEAK